MTPLCSSVLLSWPKMEISSLLIYGLAVWRISSLIVSEDGPFRAFRFLRTLTGIQHDAEGHVYAIPDTLPAKLFSCLWCSSVWVSGGLALLHYFSSAIAFYLALWMALSAIAIITEKWVRG